MGELDAFTVADFRAACCDFYWAHQLVLDLSEVSFVDSVGLGAIIAAIRRVRHVGGDVALVCTRPVLIRLFHTTGVDRIVTIVATAEEAARSLEAEQLHR
jgi:anti-sigma B factor antagonist